MWLTSDTNLRPYTPLPIDPLSVALPMELALRSCLQPAVSQTPPAGLYGFVRSGSADHPRLIRPSLLLRERDRTAHAPPRSCGSRDGGCRGSTNFPLTPATVADEVALARSSCSLNARLRDVLRSG